MRRTSSASQGESGPKHPPSTTASTSNRFTAEASADAEVAAGLAEAPEHGRVALLRPPHELAGEVARATAAADLDPRAAGDRLLSRERLEAAGRAAVAERAVRVDRDMPELAAVAVGAAEGLAADEDPAADADLGEHADEVVEIAGDALPVLGERGEVGLVVGVHGEPREPGGDLARNRDLRPAQVRSPEEGPRLRLDDARDATATPTGTRSSAATASSARSAIRASRFSTGPGLERRLSVCTCCSCRIVPVRSSTQTAR